MFATVNTLTTINVFEAIFAGVVVLGVLAAGAGFLIQSFRSGKDQKSNEETTRQDKVDKTLKELVEVQEKRYLQLERDHKENIKQIGILQGTVAEQSKQQKWFESIFVSALDKFFKDNPEVANELNGKLKKTGQK